MNSRAEDASPGEVAAGETVPRQPRETSAQRPNEPSYFEFQAMFGATKHGGGTRATRELVELCRIVEGSHVLDVGCGVGITPCHLAKRHGCRVVGVDIRQNMIDQARKRPRREGVEHLVDLQVADAQDLPFEDALFDAVIGESVTAFLEDKARGVSEFARVTKPGACVGLNEVTWLKPEPPSALVEYYFLTTGTRPETSADWRQLLVGAGLAIVTERSYKMQVLREYIDGLRRFGPKELLSTGLRFWSLALTSPAFRRFARAAIPSMSVVKAIFGYLGYGIYVGRR